MLLYGKDNSFSKFGVSFKLLIGLLHICLLPDVAAAAYRQSTTDVWGVNLRIAPPHKPMPKDCCHFE